MISLSNHVKSSKAARADGYTAYTAKIVCKFQKIVEREISRMPASEQVTAYDGLKAALLKARTMPVIGYEADDMMSLRAIYNDTLFSDANIAYSAR